MLNNTFRSSKGIMASNYSLLYSVKSDISWPSKCLWKVECLLLFYRPEGKSCTILTPAFVSLAGSYLNTGHASRNLYSHMAIVLTSAALHYVDWNRQFPERQFAPCFKFVFIWHTQYGQSFRSTLVWNHYVWSFDNNKCFCLKWCIIRIRLGEKHYSNG